MLMMSIRSKNLALGFTLVEIAVVLVIVGLLLSGIIGTFSSRIDSTRIANTENELEEIKQVLMAYAFTQTPPRLPCPDFQEPPIGLQDPGADCDSGVKVGVLPWLTLGMARADAWNKRYSYWVDPDYSKGLGFDLSLGSSTSAQINTRLNDNAQAISGSAVAVVFSRGKNGYGAYNEDGFIAEVVPAVGYDDENENDIAGVNPVFISRSATELGVTADGGPFDDVLVWITSLELKAKMVEAGVLPSP